MPLETKSSVARETTDGWITNIKVIHLNDKAGLGGTDFTRLPPVQCVYRYFPENINRQDLWMDMVSINYWNVIKIVMAIFEKIVVLCFGAHLKGS
jgi:hypothetical protein